MKKNLLGFKYDLVARECIYRNRRHGYHGVRGSHDRATATGWRETLLQVTARLAALRTSMFRALYTREREWEAVYCIFRYNQPICNVYIIEIASYKTREVKSRFPIAWPSSAECSSRNTSALIGWSWQLVCPALTPEPSTLHPPQSTSGIFLFSTTTLPPRPLLLVSYLVRDQKTILYLLCLNLLLSLPHTRWENVNLAAQFPTSRLKSRRLPRTTSALHLSSCPRASCHPRRAT